MTDSGKCSGLWAAVVLTVPLAIVSGSIRMAYAGALRASPPHDDSTPASTLNCDAAGLAPLLTPGRILLLGEIHGTVEAPAAVASVACAAIRKGLAVVVALELPLEEESRIDRFLASDGGAAARAELLAGDFWQRDYQDGRSSRAMLGLIESLRELDRSGADLGVALLDSTRRFESGQARDDFLGRRLVERVESSTPDTLILALTGNIHSRSTKSVPWDAAYRPAGIALDSRWPERTLSILLRGPPGEAWICSGSEASTCGARHVGGDERPDGGQLELYRSVREGHDGCFRLPSLTASPPAVGPSGEKEPIDRGGASAA